MDPVTEWPLPDPIKVSDLPKPINKFHFATALTMLFRGDRMARLEWGPGVYLLFTPAQPLDESFISHAARFTKVSRSMDLPGVHVEAWLPTMNDLMADDWCIARR